MVEQKKVLLLGDGAVGKTSLVHRYVEGVFQERYKATIGVDIFSKNVTTANGDCELQLWDLSGQTHFSAVRGKFYQKAQGALLVFDLTNRPSFENLDNWISEAKNAMDGEEMPMVIIGNKSDLADLVAVSDDEMSSFSEAKGWTWAKSSAKTGENVESSFETIANIVMG
ncbi:MAG: Rab family GTPase [Candidatus Hodarchaeales archaeon]|jgi:Ras-related protein Rab-11A